MAQDTYGADRAQDARGDASAASDEAPKRDERGTDGAAVGGAAAPAAAEGGAAAGGTAASAAAPTGTPTARVVPTTTSFLNFDTLIQLSLFDGDFSKHKAILDDAKKLCARFERLFSRTVSEGDVAQINRSAGKQVTVDPLTIELLKASIHYCELSQGRFDITMGAVTRIWDFHNGVIPEEEALKEALSKVDYRKIAISGNLVTLQPPLQALDLGGTAKGFIADKIAALFASRGVSKAIINLGGNVLVMGCKPDGSFWRVGLRDPNDPEKRMCGVIETVNRSVVTSGLYERCFTKDGVFYHHILDVKTGYPAKTDLKSVSVISEKSVDGDGFSTTLFLLGREQAIEFVESQPGIEAILVDDQDRISFTSGVATGSAAAGVAQGRGDVSAWFTPTA